MAPHDLEFSWQFGKAKDHKLNQKNTKTLFYLQIEGKHNKKCILNILLISFSKNQKNIKTKHIYHNAKIKTKKNLIFAQKKTYTL